MVIQTLVFESNSLQQKSGKAHDLSRGMGMSISYLVLVYIFQFVFSR